MAAAPLPTTAAVVAVAFSGGPDSLALLHVTCRSAAALGLQVVALHVHHGLLPEADGWQRQAQALCARWQGRGRPVTLRCTRLAGSPQRGDSIEAWARQGRYAALADMALEAGAAMVLLGQHRRDQAETVLLQALRGAGPAGLSGMVRNWQQGGITFVRPWLDQPREAILAYLKRHRLKAVQDPTNADPSLARGRLRLKVWPALQSAFADAETALAAVAARAQQADAALDELAALDLAPLWDGLALRVPGWLVLSPARQANALRAWLRAQPGVVVSQALIDRLLADLPRCQSGQWPAGAGQVCVLYRGRLACRVLSAVTTPPAENAPHSGDQHLLDLSTPGRYAVPGWQGHVEVIATTSDGIAPQHLVAVRPANRSGGERLALAPNAPPRSLKKQYQSLGVPADQRGGPLLWLGDQLLFVPGLGIDARWWAPGGQPQLALRWRPGTVTLPARRQPPD